MYFRSILLAACLTSVATLRAQVLIDDFSTSANFGPSGSFLGNGVMTISSGVASYTVPTATTNDFAYRNNLSVVGSYTSNWSVRLDVAYATPSSFFSAGVEQAINVGLSVTPTGSSYGLNGSSQPTFYSFGITYNLFQDASNAYSREFRTGYFVANSDFADDTSRYNQISVSGATSTSILISFNATTKMLVAGYDANGATGGYYFITMNAISQDMVDAHTWGMTASDTFTISITGNSLYDGGASGLGPTISAGQITMDNLSGTGLTAVPEPSTYAAIGGALALGVATWSRRRKTPVRQSGLPLG